IKGESARENSNPIRHIGADCVTEWFCSGRRGIECRGEHHVRFRSGESGEFVLFGEKWAWPVSVNARRIKPLGQKSNRTARERHIGPKVQKIVSRIKNGCPRLLHCDIPT